MVSKRLYIQGPDGANHDVTLRSDKRTSQLADYITTGFEYLASTGELRGNKNPETQVLTGNLPFKVKTKKGHVYSSFREDIEGDDTVVVDETLGKYETIGQMTHELVHGLFPKASEHEVQVKAAKFLRTMAKDYELMTSPQNEKNFRDKGLNPKGLSKRDLARAYKQVVSSEIYGLNKNNFKKKLGLERVVGTFFLISLGWAAFSFSKINGAVIGSLNNNFESQVFSLIGLFFLGLLFISIKKWPSKKVIKIIK